MDFRPEGAAKRRKPRKLFSRLLVWCVFIAFIGMGAWWAYTSGLFLTAAERDTGVANPPASTEPEDFDGTDEEAANPASSADQPVYDRSAEQLLRGVDRDIQTIRCSQDRKRRSGAYGKRRRERRSCRSTDFRKQRCRWQYRYRRYASMCSSNSPASHRRLRSRCSRQRRADADHGRMRFSDARRLRSPPLQHHPGKVRCAASGYLRPLAAAHCRWKLPINSDVDGKARGINLYAVRVLPGQ